jgi:hypothetical protein
MLEELRSNPRPAAARSQEMLPGRGRGPGGGLVDPILSTAFADGGRLRSTGVLNPIHRAWVGQLKEEVG